MHMRVYACNSVQYTTFKNELKLKKIFFPICGSNHFFLSYLLILEGINWFAIQYYTCISNLEKDKIAEFKKSFWK